MIIQDTFDDLTIFVSNKKNNLKGVPNLVTLNNIPIQKPLLNEACRYTRYQELGQQKQKSGIQKEYAKIVLKTFSNGECLKKKKWKMRLAQC